MILWVGLTNLHKEEPYTVHSLSNLRQHLLVRAKFTTLCIQQMPGPAVYEPVHYSDLEGVNQLVFKRVFDKYGWEVWLRFLP